MKGDDLGPLPPNYEPNYHPSDHWQGMIDDVAKAEAELRRVEGRVQDSMRCIFNWNMIRGAAKGDRLLSALARAHGPWRPK
jgi:hypothetical protein